MTDINYLEKYLPKNKLKEGIERLQNGEPVQYIVGNVNFYGNEIKVNDGNTWVNICPIDAQVEME